PHASAGAVDRCTPDHTAPDWTRAGCWRPDFPSGQAGAAITARSASVHPAAPSTTIPATSVRSHTPRLIAHPRRLAPGARFRPGRTDLRIRGRRTGRLRRAGAVGGDVTGARRAVRGVVRGRPAGGSPGTSRVRCAPQDGSGRGLRGGGVASGGRGGGGARSGAWTGTPAKGLRGLGSPCLHSALRAGHGLRFERAEPIGPPRANYGAVGRCG